MGAALASSTLINAKCENISCCTSVAAVHPPIIRRTGGFLKKRMTTIYVDSRKRVAGSDSDFEVDLGESLHLQSDARLAVYKIRLADSFLSTDRGRYLYWVDADLFFSMRLVRFKRRSSRCACLLQYQPLFFPSFRFLGVLWRTLCSI